MSPVAETIPKSQMRSIMLPCQLEDDSKRQGNDRMQLSNGRKFVGRASDEPTVQKPAWRWALGTNLK